MKIGVQTKFECKSGHESIDQSDKTHSKAGLEDMTQAKLYFDQGLKLSKTQQSECLRQDSFRIRV